MNADATGTGEKRWALITRLKARPSIDREIDRETLRGSIGE